MWLIQPGRLVVLPFIVRLWRGAGGRADGFVLAGAGDSMTV